MKLKYSTYKTLLTCKRTMLVISKGKCGYKDYKELQISYRQGNWIAELVDGYRTLEYKIFTGDKSIKSIINNMI